MSVGERKNVVQSGSIQPISEAPAASHTPHVSVCDVRMKCDSVSVAVLSHFFIQCHNS